MASERGSWKDVDWRRHQRWVRAGGCDVLTVEAGPADGPPVVFVHGLSGSWVNWLENVPALAAAGFRCLALDLPGFGASPMPPWTIEIRRYGELVDQWMGACGIQEGAAIVGNSMGGYIAAEVAIRFPQRAEQLVLVSAAGISTQQLRHDRGHAVLERLERVLGVYGALFVAQAELVARRPRLRRAALGLVVRHPERLDAALVVEQLRGQGKPGFVQAVRALTTYPIEDRLEQIACPTLVVWGRQDRLVPVRDGHRFHELIEDSRLLVYEDTGHVAQLERPERFNADLLAFLREAPGESVGGAEGEAADAA